MDWKGNEGKGTVWLSEILQIFGQFEFSGILHILYILYIFAINSSYNKWEEGRGKKRRDGGKSIQDNNNNNPENCGNCRWENCSLRKFTNYYNTLFIDY